MSGQCNLCYLINRTVEDEATARAASMHPRHTLFELVGSGARINAERPLGHDAMTFSDAAQALVAGGFGRPAVVAPIPAAQAQVPVR